MNENTNRKLAAIFFADIVGYTALMQTDEVRARQMLDKFHFTIATTVEEYKGQVINNYGDGCLCTFDSAVAAVQCAQAIQQAFQTLPKVPVRIGLHSGDVFFEKDNVYGDSVNIASRIESLGIAGGVLFSKRIKRHIANQAEFEVQSLGEFEFKNVNKTMEVFALTNEGLAVPKLEDMQGKVKITPPVTKKKNKWLVPSLLGLFVLAFVIWKFNPFGSAILLSNNDSTLSKDLRQKRVAVMVFDNKTGSENLEDFGTMISDWLTKGLMETGEANVISAANIQNQIQLAGVGADATQKLAQKTGVGILLQGRYYSQEDQLIIHSNIVDAEKGEVIYALDPIQGPKQEMLNLLDELTQKVLGYWAVKDQKRFLQNPPKYKAWQKYLEAEKLWGSDEFFEKRERLLQDAYQLDPNFYAPLLKLAVHYGNRGSGRSPAKQDSVFQMIEALDPDFSQWEQLRYSAIRASSDNDYLKSAQINEQMYRMDASDGNANYNAAWSYIRANRPQKAMELLKDFDPRYRDMDDDFSWVESRGAEAYYMLGQYEKIPEVARNYPFPKVLEQTARLHLRALVRMDSIETIRPAYETYKEKGVYNFGGAPRDAEDLLDWICVEAYLLDKKDLLAEYASLYKNWLEQGSDPDNTSYDLAWPAFYLGDYKTALSLWEEEDIDPRRNWPTVRNLSRLGVCHVLLGDLEKAEAILNELEAIELNNLPINLYGIARIQAALGRTKEAIQNLKTVQEEGLIMAPVTRWFHNDIFLKPLYGNPAFEELMKPKG